MTFKKILIANRGEIACRIARTARRLGIACAGVYSDHDRSALHVQSVDEAVWIGPSYLDSSKIIEAAKRVGADAIHPGYGFLAENADFAEACAAAGLIFIGPRPETMRQLGSKAGGRSIAESCGVPVVPGYQGDNLAEGAEALGYPLMIKASAGGGGRGMRLVTKPEDFQAARESAEREAGAAFGDGTLILERAVVAPHHVEVQIFGDTHGNVIHLFERDCSVQRRHQKLIEECPSPAIDDTTRKKLYEAAVAIGRAVGYVNAGTVEFLIAPNGEFYFIEVNTRIQVEHPVTEMVTGLDLIEMQIRVAEGRPLDEFPLVGEPIGHAIEVRVCAEDPYNDFVPSIGKLGYFCLTADRVDNGVITGSEVTPHYDSLLAKMIVRRSTRAEAIAEMIAALKRSGVLGVATNLGYMWRILESEMFQQGRATTRFLPAPAPSESESGASQAAGALALWIHTSEIRKRKILQAVGAFRNNPYREPSVKLRSNGKIIDVPARGRVMHHSDHLLVAEIDGVIRQYPIASAGSQFLVDSTIFERVPRHPKHKSAGSNAAASSPMPGRVLRILVDLGAIVTSGDPLVVLEAMKMEQTIKSQMDGPVSAILVKVGDVVSPGQTLVQIGGS